MNFNAKHFHIGIFFVCAIDKSIMSVISSADTCFSISSSFEIFFEKCKNKEKIDKLKWIEQRVALNVECIDKVALNARKDP